MTWEYVEQRQQHTSSSLEEPLHYNLEDTEEQGKEDEDFGVHCWKKEEADEHHRGSDPVNFLMGLWLENEGSKEETLNMNENDRNNYSWCNNWQTKIKGNSNCKHSYPRSVFSEGESTPSTLTNNSSIGIASEYSYIDSWS